MDKLLAVIGPTAVGKTRLSIDLALRLGTEIISGDSMLVYRGMDIGTAKPDLAERRGVAHHLVDILDPAEEFSVVEFQEQAGALVAAIHSRGLIPVLAGGTGLYVKALLEGYNFNPVEGSEAFRAELAELAAKHGNEYVHAMLGAVLPEVAGRLHPNDLRRVIRALEVHRFSGDKVSQEKTEAGLVYDALVIGLTMDRAELYARINRRVDAMIAGGLVEEVAELLAAGVPRSAQAMQGIGYKEIARYLAGDGDLPQAVERIKQATRHFAKRQLTWYRKMPYIVWVDAGEYQCYEKMLAYIYRVAAGKFCTE